MHIVIIPSEEFLPPDRPHTGIFQYHQASILKNSNHDIGVIAVTAAPCIPGKQRVLKSFWQKLTGRNTTGTQNNFLFFPILLFRQFFISRYYLRVEKRNGINIYRINAFATEDKHKGWIKSGLIAFKNYVFQNGIPDLIHAHNAEYAGQLALAVNKKYGVKYIITEHSSAMVNNTTANKAIDEVYNYSAINTAVSTDFAKNLQKSYPATTFSVLHNVIDPAIEALDYKSIKPKENLPFTFLHIADLRPVKDQETLLRAFKIVVDNNPNTRLIIGGDGELRVRLETLSHNLGIADRIHFTGSLDRLQVVEELKICNCFVMSSVYETFCVALIEALWFGKPVISVNQGGPLDIVNAGNGILVDKQCPEMMAKAMLRMIYEYDQYDAEAIRKDCIEKFGSLRFVNNLHSILDNLSV